MVYFDIDSTYRDRTLYPNPADFQVSQQYRLCGEDTDINPVSSASIDYPIHYTYGYIISSPQANQVVIDPLNYRLKSIYFATDNIPRNQNIFNDQILEIFNDDPELVTITNSFYTVVDTVYNTEQVLVESGVTNAYDPFLFNAYAQPDRTTMFLTDDSSDLDGFYVGKTVYVDGIVGVCTNYSGGNRLMTLDKALPSWPTNQNLPYAIYALETWTLILDRDVTFTGVLSYPAKRIRNYNYVYRNLFRIRETTEAEYEDYIGTVTNPYTMVLTNFPGDATGQWLGIVNQEREIHSGTVVAEAGNWQAFSETGTVTIPSTAGIDPSNTVFINRVGTVLAVWTIVSVDNATQLTLVAGSPFVITAGDLFWVSQINPIVNENRLIESYDTATQTAVLSSPFSSTVMENDIYQIIAGGIDGYVPLDIPTGLNTSNPQCWDITLHSISIPNTPISNGFGNRVAFYPFIYVQFTSVNKQYMNEFITNVPDISNVLFKVPVYDVRNPRISDFVVLVGLGMIQTVRFKFKDNFIVRLLLPDGQVIQFAENDSVLPFPPRPELQISYTFSVTKVEYLK
jgi:hypothetical protein